MITILACNWVLYKHPSQCLQINFRVSTLLLILAAILWNILNPRSGLPSDYFLAFFTYHAMLVYMYWMLVLLGAFYLIEALKSRFNSHQVEFKCYSKLQLNILRKAFHFAIFCIIIVPIRFCNDISVFYLVQACSSVVLLSFVAVEFIRIHYPFSMVSTCITGYMIRFTGHSHKKNRVKPITDHIYLMAGVTLPLLISAPNSLESLSGCITLGLGDSAAALGGCTYGIYRIPGSNGKTVGGALCCIVALFLSSMLLSYSQISFWESLVLSTITSVVEVYSPINDNIVLPLTYWVVLKKLIKPG